MGLSTVFTLYVYKLLQLHLKILGIYVTLICWRVTRNCYTDLQAQIELDDESKQCSSYPLNYSYTFEWSHYRIPDGLTKKLGTVQNPLLTDRSDGQMRDLLFHGYVFAKKQRNYYCKSPSHINQMTLAKKMETATD